jgi:hypothetical protein
MGSARPSFPKLANSSYSRASRFSVELNSCDVIDPHVDIDGTQESAWSQLGTQSVPW